MEFTGGPLVTNRSMSRSHIVATSRQ